MGYFTDELHVHYLGMDDGTGRWMLLRSFFFHSDKFDLDIKVPKGFIHDFASVPRIPFIYSLFGGYAKQSAIIHDWLYHKKPVSRKTADKIFLEAMIAENTPPGKRQMMYQAVRMGGGSHW